MNINFGATPILNYKQKSAQSVILLEFNNCSLAAWLFLLITYYIVIEKISTIVHVPSYFRPGTRKTLAYSAPLSSFSLFMFSKRPSALYQMICALFWVHKLMPQSKHKASIRKGPILCASHTKMKAQLPVSLS